jgi:hypothetical protein
MSLFFVIALVALFNFFVGAATTYIISIGRSTGRHELKEKEIYCHGFEDGIYYTLDEYNPELYRPEIAEMCYKEYKAIKYGPEKH